jgi:hypothetical protein
MRNGRRVPTEAERFRQQAALATEAERLHAAKNRLLDAQERYLEDPAHSPADPAYDAMDLKIGRIVGHLVGTIERLGRITGRKYEMTFDGVLRPQCGTAILTETLAHGFQNREVIMTRVHANAYRITLPEAADVPGVLERGLDEAAWAGALQ